MGKRKYTGEFKESAVRLVTVEKYKVAAAAERLGMPEATLNAWVGQSRRGTGGFRPQGVKDQASLLAEAQAEIRRLRMERDILKKAATFFAKEAS